MAVISVTEISLSVKACFDSGLFKNVEVLGEISGFKTSGPHAYFALKDEKAAIQCSCFQFRKTYIPKDGEQVIVRGDLDYYVKGGRLSIIVREIKPYGDGLLALKFEQLKKQLQSEGLFDESHKKPIPKYNKNVLVLTSKTGAVIRDIVTTVRNKNPYTNIVVRDVRVQGEGAGAQIAAALKNVDNLGYDVIVIARGGGSLEDLAPFYDETLARAVYAAKTPIVSAVGHETDFSLCDFVADKRAATPTAAAELVAFDFYKTLEYIEGLDLEAIRCLDRLFKTKSHKLEVLNAKFSKAGSEFYGGKEKKILSLSNALVAGAKKTLNKCVVRLKDLDVSACNLIKQKETEAEQKAKAAFASLDNLSPLKTLKRGYFKISKGDMQINGVKSLAVGDVVKARGYDGSVEAKIEKISLNEGD